MLHSQVLLFCSLLCMASCQLESEQESKRDPRCPNTDRQFNLLKDLLEVMQDDFENRMETVQCDKQLQVMREQIRALEEGLQKINETVQQLHDQPKHPAGTFRDPASSCKDLPPESPSGEYWIFNIDSPVLMYCDMERSYGNATGGWTRVAHLDMTDSSERCPDGLATYNRLCERYASARGCVSTIFPVNGVEYSRVCGRVLTYQWKILQAFAPYYMNQSRTIEDLYVDGVSLTHGHSPRQHIWTFAAALNGETSDWRGCPCIQNDANFTGIVPPFIGDDYFCDTGRLDRFDTGNYAQGRLWDGEGCGANSTCCSFNNPPWFCKQLQEPTTDDIELRQCVVGSWGSGGSEISLKVVEIFVN